MLWLTGPVANLIDTGASSQTGNNIMMRTTASIALKSWQNGRRVRDVFKFISLYDNCCTLIQIYPRSVLSSPLVNKSALVPDRTWRRTANKPLLGPIMDLLTHSASIMDLIIVLHGRKLGNPGSCLTTATCCCRNNFSQRECSFLWKLRCHWLKGSR